MVIAVDFDGTIVEHRYPRIGEEIPFAIDTLKLLQQEKHRLILWSVREGALLDEAVEWCKARGLEFYAINKDYPEEQKDHQGFSRQNPIRFRLVVLGSKRRYGKTNECIVCTWSFEPLRRYAD